jgi:hypothetical protein
VLGSTVLWLFSDFPLTILRFIYFIIPPQTKFEGVYRSELVGRSVGRSDSSFPDDNS